MTILDNLLLPCYHKSLDDKNAFLVAENRHNVFGYVDGTLYQWTKSTGRNLLNNQVDLTIKTPVDIFNEKMNAYLDRFIPLERDIIISLVRSGIGEDAGHSQRILAMRFARHVLSLHLSEAKELVDWIGTQ